MTWPSSWPGKENWHDRAQNCDHHSSPHGIEPAAGEGAAGSGWKAGAGTGGNPRGTRVFGPGQCFYSNDTLPPGATFDPTVHGHCSRQLGDEPLVTLFVRA